MPSSCIVSGFADADSPTIRRRHGITTTADGSVTYVLTRDELYRFLYALHLMVLTADSTGTATAIFRTYACSYYPCSLHVQKVPVSNLCPKTAFPY